jgi:Thioredoxin
MKTLVLYSILFFSLVSVSLFPQDKNYKTHDSESDEPMLLGYCNLDAFKDTSFSWWWNSEYLIYNVDSLSAEKLKVPMKDTKITVVMGSWCSDSRTWVPEFFKIIDLIKYPSDSIKIICVDRDMHGRNDEVKNLNIEKVPTFIFYRDNKELGRIIEEPKASLEKDMVGIFDK